MAQNQAGVHLGLGFNEGGASVCNGVVVGLWGGSFQGSTLLGWCGRSSGGGGRLAENRLG